jgi:predicted amidohydrolase YtcJ
LLIRRAEIDGRGPLDVRSHGETIARIAPQLAPLAGEQVLDAAGGALLPGLHDHHIHLLALAAARASTRCGPPEVSTASELAQVLAAALQSRPRRDGWLRAIGYHESVAGPLDHRRLEELCPGVPLRLQHRSGALWMLNTSGLARLGLARGGADRVPDDAPPGVERDAQGRATGRLYRLDAWLRERWSARQPPTLEGLGLALSRFGVTGVTDATPGNRAGEAELLAAAVSSGALPQRLRIMGAERLTLNPQAGVELGEWKLLLAEDDLPSFDELQRQIEAAHAQERAVAIHCVTRAELALAAAAIAAAGSRPGDRIEHAAIAPPDLAAMLAELGLCVVTQPNFIRERGDDYLAEVDSEDQPWLYRCRGLLDASVSLAGGTDAPFGDPDPWLAIRAAVERRSPSGVCIGPQEALSPERALALFTSAADRPGGPPRRVAAGEAADLCLLDRPWSRAREELSSGHVVATITRGTVAWRADEPGG